MVSRLDSFGRRLAKFLTGPARMAPTVATCDAAALAAALRLGDVLLVEGNTRVSTAIKYLTQSTWSHAALYVGDALAPPPAGEEPRVLVEADLAHGVRAVPLSEYAECYNEILHIRHYSLFAPRDFDISPYFRIVKPGVEEGFDYRGLTWADDDSRPQIAA